MPRAVMVIRSLKFTPVRYPASRRSFIGCGGSARLGTWRVHRGEPGWLGGTEGFDDLISMR
jgi:hypothetical protein